MAGNLVRTAGGYVGRNPAYHDMHLRGGRADETMGTGKKSSWRQVADFARVVGRRTANASVTMIRDIAIIAFSPSFTRRSLSHIAQATVTISVF